MPNFSIGVDLGGTNLRNAAVDRQGTLMEKNSLGTKTGVGGGIVMDGEIWHGMSGMAGEFGHMTVEPAGPQCGCGNRGCLEPYASATAVMRMAREAVADGDAPGLARAASSDVEFSAKEIYNLALQGDEQARKIFRRVGRALGISLATMINGLTFEMYVIGDEVSRAWAA